MKAFSLILFFLISCSRLPSKRTDKYSILQGITNTKEVEFSVVAPKGKSLRFELRNADGLILVPLESKTVSREDSSYAVYKSVFERDQKNEYNLYVYDGTKIVDQRLVGKGQRESSRLRLAVVSCMNDYYSKDFKIWDTVARKNPDYLLMIGDNVYADSSSKSDKISVNPGKLWERYIDVRLSLPIYFQEKLIPTHGLWDDHDYGLANGGEEFEHKKESQIIFEAFFAQGMTEDDWEKGPGISGVLSLGDFNLYFLDGRSFRPKDVEGKHLGDAQKAWLFKDLTSEAKPSFIIKGDQFFGGYHRFDSYEGNHPKDFQLFVNDLKKLDTPFIFMSGDRHMSEIMQFPRGMFARPSFEITSSPIHALTFPDSVDQNPWRVVSQKNNVNFTIVDNKSQDNHWFIDVENYGINGELYYRRELAVYIKDLQNNLNEIRKRRSGKRRYRKSNRRRR